MYVLYLYVCYLYVISQFKAHLQHHLPHTRSYMSFREEVYCQFVPVSDTLCSHWARKHQCFGVITRQILFIVTWHWDWITYNLCRLLCLMLAALEAFVIQTRFHRVGLIYAYVVYALWNFSHIYGCMLFRRFLVTIWNNLGGVLKFNTLPFIHALNRLPLYYAHIFVLPCLFYVITLVVYLPHVCHICNDRLLRKFHNSNFRRIFNKLVYGLLFQRNASY